MEKFHGTVHLPGTDKPMDMELDVDWEGKWAQCNVILDKGELVS